MTRYVERLDEVRSFLKRFDLPKGKREQLLDCKCWFFVNNAWAHLVFRTQPGHDKYYEHFTLWHMGAMDAREFWAS